LRAPRPDSELNGHLDHSSICATHRREMNPSIIPVEFNLFNSHAHELRAVFQKLTFLMKTGERQRHCAEQVPVAKHVSEFMSVRVGKNAV
jgi:hypothetical protein